MPGEREQLESMLSAYLDGELTEQERAEVEAFLAADAGARELLDDLRTTAEGLAALPRAKASDDFSDALRSHLERRALLGAEAPTRMPRVSSPSSFGRRLATAAVIALATLAGYFTWSLTREPVWQSQRYAMKDGARSGADRPASAAPAAKPAPIAPTEPKAPPVVAQRPPANRVIAPVASSSKRTEAESSGLAANLERGTAGLEPNTPASPGSSAKSFDNERFLSEKQEPTPAQHHQEAASQDRKGMPPPAAEPEMLAANTGGSTEGHDATSQGRPYGTTTGTAELRPSAAPARPPMALAEAKPDIRAAGAPAPERKAFAAPKTTPSLSAADTLDSRQRITIDGIAGEQSTPSIEPAVGEARADRAGFNSTPHPSTAHHAAMPILGPELSSQPATGSVLARSSVPAGPGGPLIVAYHDKTPVSVRCTTSSATQPVSRLIFTNAVATRSAPASAPASAPTATRPASTQP